HANVRSRLAGDVYTQAAVSSSARIGRKKSNRVLLAQLETDVLAGAPQLLAVPGFTDDVGLGAGFGRESVQSLGVNVLGIVAANHERADREGNSAAAPVWIADSDRVHQHAHPPRLRNDVIYRRRAGVVHSVRDHQQRLLVVASALNHLE